MTTVSRPRLVAIATDRAARSRRVSRRRRDRPRPRSRLERRSVRPEPGPPLPLACRLGAARRHQRAIKAAANDANDTRASKAATFDFDGSGPSLIGYGAGATCGVNGLACFTRDVPDSFTMWFREQGHVFDWGTMKWCEAYASPPNGCYDAENVALDEFGHVEGLGHHDNYDSDSDYGDAVVQTYSRTKPSAGYNGTSSGGATSRGSRSCTTC